MKPISADSFTNGDVHCNRNGYYRVESSSGDEVICRYLESGTEFKGSQTRLKHIEKRHLGYNLPSVRQARQILKSRGVLRLDMVELTIVTMAGLALEEERKKRDKDRIQKLYEERLRRDGKDPAIIQEATKNRESGCHKCKHTPLLSEILYECPICIGMVCRVCGSCLCNWNPKENPKDRFER